jgi:HlyD family secretion protein
MKRLAVILPIVLIAGGIALWWFVLRAEDTPEGRLVLSGTIEAETTEVGTEVAGRVLRVASERGDFLREGDVVAELSTEIGETRLSQAEAASEAARQGEEQARVAASVQQNVLAAQVQQAERTLATAEAQLADLLAGARPESIREAQAGVRQAEAALRASREQLAKAREGPRAQEVAQARAGLDRADQQVVAAEARVDELREGTRAQDIEQARAALQSAQATASKAAKDAGRMEELYAEGVISEDRLEQAQTAAETARESVRSARAALDRALEGPREQAIRAADADLAQAQAARRQAREQLELLQEGTRAQDIRAAEAEVERAEGALEAARQRLAALEAGPTEEQIRIARRQVDEARAALNTARRRLREAEVAREQADVAQRQAEQAEAAAEEASVSLSKHVIHASSPGVVDSVNARKGEVVSPGSSLVTTIEPEDLWVTVFVPEPEMPRVEVGQEAVVEVDGYEGQFPAEVTWIAEEAEFTPKYVLTEAERTKLVYELRVRPDDPDGRLKPGMPADVTIFTDGRRGPEAN